MVSELHFKTIKKKIKARFGAFPVIQWLGLHPSPTGGQGFDPWLGDEDPACNTAQPKQTVRMGRISAIWDKTEEIKDNFEVSRLDKSLKRMEMSDEKMRTIRLRLCFVHERSTENAVNFLFLCIDTKGLVTTLYLLT